MNPLTVSTQRCWKSASPTAKISSRSRMSGARFAAIANPSRMYMPGRVVLDRDVDEVVESRIADDGRGRSLRFPDRSGRGSRHSGTRSRGRSAPDESRRRARSSRRSASAAATSRRPLVGRWIAAMSFRNVLLPEPLRPIRPDRFAVSDLQRDVLQRPELFDRLPVFRGCSRPRNRTFSSTDALCRSRNCLETPRASITVVTRAAP